LKFVTALHSSEGGMFSDVSHFLLDVSEHYQPSNDLGRSSPKFRAPPCTQLHIEHNMTRHLHSHSEQHKRDSLHHLILPINIPPAPSQVT